MKNKVKENFLEKIPVHNPDLNWSVDEQNLVVLEMQNKGFANLVAQKLLKKPKISYIHLEQMGSFIWPLIDGERDIIKIGESVHEHFGDKAEPLYERLSQYFKSLESNKFITWK